MSTVEGTESTATSTPVPPQPGPFAEETLSFPTTYAGSKLESGGRYSSSFQQSDSLTEVFNYSTELGTQSEDGFYIENATAYVVGQNLRRVEYDGSVTWESASELEITQGPVVGEDTVLVKTSDRIIGYDRETGKELWIQEGVNPLSAEGNFFYYGDGARIGKRRIDDGTEVWETDPSVEGDFGTYEPQHDEIFMTSDHIIIGMRSIQTRNTILTSISKNQGSQEWITQDPIFPAIRGYMIQNNKLITYSYIDNDDIGKDSFLLNRVYDIENGSKQLEIQTPKIDFQRPYIGHVTSDETNLYSLGDKKLVAHDLEDGTKVWETLLSSRPSPAIACTKDSVYIVQNGDLIRYNSGDGTESRTYDVSFGDALGIYLAGDHIVKANEPDVTGDGPSEDFALTGFAPPEE
jgi:outer membrane protein assembly factor BamB